MLGFAHVSVFLHALLMILTCSQFGGRQHFLSVSWVRAGLREKALILIGKYPERIGELLSGGRVPRLKLLFLEEQRHSDVKRGLSLPCMMLRGK